MILGFNSGAFHLLIVLYMAWVTVLRACLWPSEGSIEVDGPTNSEDDTSSTRNICTL